MHHAPKRPILATSQENLSSTVYDKLKEKDQKQLNHNQTERVSITKLFGENFHKSDFKRESYWKLKI